MARRPGPAPISRRTPQPELLRAEDLVLHGFELKVNKEGPNGCWLWLGSVGQTGYGKFSFLNTTWLPHRVSYLLYKGPIMRGLFVCHTCDVPRCVNPDHLFLGLPKDNTHDMIKKGRKGKSNFPLYGFKSPNRKLNKQQVREILSSNEGPYILAKRYPVSPAAITYLRKNPKAYAEFK